jgi:large subunit ribosomal protein L25
MSELLLTAHTGRVTGTRSSRRLRADGLVPAVVYGLGADPVSVAVEWPALRKALTTDAGVNALLTLDIEGNQQLSIVKEIQRHPTRRDVIHVDFIRLDANAEVEIEVPVLLIGEALKVTQVSGMVDQTMFTLTVLSKPDAIPDELSIDISELEVGEAIHVSDMALPAGVRTEVDPEETIASALVTRSTLEAMREEEEAEAAADLGGEEGAAPSAEGDAEGDADADGDSDGDDS